MTHVAAKRLEENLRSDSIFLNAFSEEDIHLSLDRLINVRKVVDRSII